jgi:hypothetical protein
MAFPLLTARYRACQLVRLVAGVRSRARSGRTSAASFQNGRSIETSFILSGHPTRLQAGRATDAPAWQVVTTEGDATDRLRLAPHAHASADAPARSDLPWPREYRGAYLQRRRNSGFTLHKALGITRDDMAARRRQELENFRFFGAPHVALITSDEALAHMARSIAAPMSPTSCSRRSRWEWRQSPKQRWRVTRRFCANIFRYPMSDW